MGEENILVRDQRSQVRLLYIDHTHLLYMLGLSPSSFSAYLPHKAHYHCSVCWAWICHIVLVILVTLSISGCEPQMNNTSGSTTTPLRVAVASNFYAVLKQLTTESKQWDDKLTLIPAATGTLATQITHGAPFDIFLAADESSISTLHQQGSIIAPVNYTQGQLALWAPHHTFTHSEQPSDLMSTQSFDGNAQRHTVKSQLKAILTEPRFSRINSRIAIAEPALAPYGQATMETLEHIGFSNRNTHQIVYGGNINQTYLFVESGNVPMGFIALSQARLQGLTSTQYLPVPVTFHAPIIQSGGILATSTARAEAHAFMQWLLSATIQSQLHQLGYLPVSKQYLSTSHKASVSDKHHE